MDHGDKNLELHWYNRTANQVYFVEQEHLSSYDDVP